MVFSANTTIGAADATYDGQDIEVRACTLTINGSHAFASLLAANGSTVKLAGGETLTVSGRLAVTGYSTVACQGKDVSAQVDGRWAGVGVTIGAGSVTIESGSLISADGRGYTTACGPGGSSGSGTGGSYGERGAGGAAPYGSALQPQDLDSGGGAFGYNGGWSLGGGAIRLQVEGTLTLAGKISADGQSSAGWSGGGAGGSLWVTADILTGGGLFSAAGSLVSGGGRIAVYYRDGSGFGGFTTSTTAAGAASGQDGTLAFVDTSVPNTCLRLYQRFRWEADSQPHFGAATSRAGGTGRRSGGERRPGYPPPGGDGQRGSGRHCRRWRWRSSRCLSRTKDRPGPPAAGRSC